MMHQARPMAVESASARWEQFSELPAICHRRYRSLSEIIRLSASECGIAYREYPTLLVPVSKHLKLLKRLATSN